MNAIGQGMKLNKGLTHLSMRGNLIESDGLKELVKSFRLNKLLKLKSIDLSSNRIDDVAGVQLASCLKSQRSVEAINLKFNNLDSESCLAFLYLI